MLKPLPNPIFFPELLSRIDRARKSVTIVNFLAMISPASKYSVRKSNHVDPIEDLARRLIRAKKRGCQVGVFLEGSKLEENYQFYRLLKDAGVDIWLDTSLTFIHHKVALIDDKFLFVGSHNLTAPSVTQSEEYSVLTDSQAAIRNFGGELKKISRQRDTVQKDVCREGLSLPRVFIKDHASRLFRAHAENAFDLYLIIMKEESSPGAAVAINENRWCVELGFPPPAIATEERYRKYFFKQRANRILYALQNNFKLISIDRKTGTVKRTNFDSAGEKAVIPFTYWRHGWPARLSFTAKYFYMIALSETLASPFYPWWRLSMKEINKAYGCAHDIGAGARELANFNILEMPRSRPVRRGESYSQEAQFYRLNPFYDMADFEGGLSKLRNEFRAPIAALAQKTAALFFAGHDLETIAAVCALIKKYGHEKVTLKSQQIARLPSSSSRRAITYLEELLETNPDGGLDNSP